MRRKARTVKRSAGRAHRDYCCGGGGGRGAGAVRRGRGRIWPQFRPIMQSVPLAWGWTASLQQTPSGDAGVGAAIGAGPTSIGEGAALVSGIAAPPIPPSPSASTAAPTHTAVLPVRFAMAPDPNFSLLNVYSRSAALGRDRTPREAVSSRPFDHLHYPANSNQRTPPACHQSYRAAWVLSGAMPCSATTSIRAGMSVQTR